MPAVPAAQVLDALESTQDEAHRLAASGAPHGTAVIARRQLKARGAHGRRWSAGDGGAWLSVVVMPATSAGIQALSLRVGLLVAQTVDHWLGEERVRLKWPNDLMLEDRKLGGILCEARWQREHLAWVVVGVGVNVINPIDPVVAPNAIALRDGIPPGCRVPDPIEVARAIAQAVSTGTMEGGMLSDGEVAEYAGRDWLAGRTIQTPVTGRVDGIDREGHLRVALDPTDDVPGRSVALLQTGSVR